MRHKASRLAFWILISACGLSSFAAAQASSARYKEAIVADHNAVVEFEHIPPHWLEAARKLTLYYGGTSHGTQPLYGASILARANPSNKISVGQWELPEPANTDALRVNYYSLEANEYWSTTEGLQKTRTAAQSGLYSHSMFSWCGEMSSLSKNEVQRYLDTLSALESEFPSMRFIYMTGHAEYVDQWSGTELERNNQMVRQYVLSHNKVLFDFYDIDTHDPAGKYHANATDACAWCASWCAKHPADCKDLETSAWPGECAHSHPFNCSMKAKAFWWMMARLAGWDGKTTTLPSSTASTH